MNEVDLDALVNDPRFLPYKGWLLDRRVPPYIDNDMPAIQQTKEEFVEFVSKLKKRDRCLQIGLGTAGASQLVFSALFNQAWTVESNITPFNNKTSNIIVGSSYDSNVVATCAGLAPFDLLFIDADKNYLRADYDNYYPMVSSGGVVAFHDAVPHQGTDSTIAVYNFVQDLKAQGHPYTTIGTLLGIAWCYKS